MMTRPIPRPRRPEPATLMWRRRAEQARRIAGMLSAPDAALLEDFARECEALAEPRRATGAPMAA